MSLAVRRADIADAETIGQLLHDFNSEFEDPTPGPEAVAERVRKLLAGGEIAVLLGGAGPHGLAVLRFRPPLWTEALDCYLEELYVVPDRRGQGLGRALMDRDRARSPRGCSRHAHRHRRGRCRRAGALRESRVSATAKASPTAPSTTSTSESSDSRAWRSTWMTIAQRANSARPGRSRRTTTRIRSVFAWRARCFATTRWLTMSTSTSPVACSPTALHRCSTSAAARGAGATLRAGAWVGADNSPTMLARAPDPAMRAEATALPFSDASLGSVALLDVLYHLPEPAKALAEVHRLLRTGGVVAVAAPSRYDSPELAHALARRPLTFDAELAPRLLGELFGEVEVSRWDAPLLELPTRRSVRDYLIGKGSDPEQADAAAEVAEIPLSVTKRGALAFARKR